MPQIFDGTTGTVPASWTTAGRPTSPSAGQTGYNTTNSQLEYWNGSSWIAVAATTNASLLTSGTLAAARLPAGSVLQVVQTVLTTTLTFSPNGAMQAVTGLSASITPSSASNKILVLVNMAMGPSIGAVIMGQLQRNGSAIGGGVPNGSSPSINTAEYYVGTAANNPPCFTGAGVVHYLDSPATTSSLTYAMFIQGDNGAASIYVNRTGRDSSSGGALDGRSSSTITLMEIVG